MITSSAMQTFLSWAYHEAAKSPDLSSQVGSIILTDGSPNVVTGFNSPTPGFHVHDEWVKGSKYAYIEHAERAAIIKAARFGCKTENATMFAPWSSCCDCARAIVLSGITTLVRHQPIEKIIPERWLESMVQGDRMMKGAGVKIIDYSGPVQGPIVRIDKIAWNPYTCKQEN